MDQVTDLRADPHSPVHDDLLTAARTFFPDASDAEIIPGHPNLAKVSSPLGLWRVRRWPVGAPISDITFSHEVMAVARNAGLTIVPAVVAPPHHDDATLRLDGRTYDAQRWLPGDPSSGAEISWPEPDLPIDVPIVLPAGIYAEVVSAIARLHEATLPMATTRGIPTAPLDLLPGAVRQAQARHLGALRAKARHEPAIQRWLATGERLIVSAEPVVLAASEDRERPNCVLHLGLWPGHVLVEHGALSGLLGWERVAAGSPLLDLAQATLRLQGWNDDAVEVALGAYGEMRHLAPQERRLLPAVAALDAVATTGRLLEQTYAVAETARPPSALRNAVEMMLRSMTALDRGLNAPSEKSRRRTWNRLAPPPAGRAKGGKPRERRR